MASSIMKISIIINENGNEIINEISIMKIMA
jgi:hypothetical protein